ncbi:MAG: ribosomal RNA small subunit methyltransferase A [Elusimicrobia bacterium]|nr:ribosomal RNA small subunit methyltransferase A [Elusimicrobiota bacterium]
MSRRLGQHFLTNPLIAEKIADVLDIRAGEKIIEIGPGKGFLTSVLLDRKAAVTGIEIDEGLALYLEKKMGGADLVMVNRDFLDVDISDYGAAKICGNIPYQLAGKIIEKIVKSGADWKTAVLMLPLAVARRLVSVPGDSEYSAVSVMCSAACLATIEFTVSRDEFDPPPKIESAVVRMARTGPPMSGQFYEVVKGAFSMRRKKIKNSLSRYFSMPAGRIEALLEAAGISSSVRAQEVPFSEFKKLTDEFVKDGIL